MYVRIYIFVSGGVECVERRYPHYLVALYVPLAIQGAIFQVLCKLRWLKAPPAPIQPPVRWLVLFPSIILSSVYLPAYLLTYVTLYFYDFLQAHLIFA